MAGKGKKKRNSKDSTASNGSGGDKKKGKSKKKTGSGKSTKFQGDIFNEGAMENAYFVCHNVQDVLRVRGFPWPEAKKKKGKKK
ncbi:Small lysine-rich protein 1 [Pseudolycoriella hygida]|uniref:Small lysine-rich protein 1 n=1 Tax=Pseudolycoriella hygida TaxID=35572 RepID=A0A9Q0NGE8_9DIPT|nr:Small lysine-rich protein 1 [Pseudolycoriella hygida]